MAKFSYDKAKNELLEILTDLEENNTTIDDLAKKVKRAKTLLKKCEVKLRSIEDELSEEEQ